MSCSQGFKKNPKIYVVFMKNKRQPQTPFGVQGYDYCIILVININNHSDKYK